MCERFCKTRANRNTGVAAAHLLLEAAEECCPEHLELSVWAQAVAIAELKVPLRHLDSSTAQERSGKWGKKVERC